MDAREPGSYLNFNDSEGSDPRRSGEFRKNALHLSAGVFERAVVVNNVVGKRDLLAVGNLRGQTGACVCFEISRRRRVPRHAGNVAGDLELVRRGDQNDAVEALTPAGGASLRIDFENQSRFDHGDGVGVLRKDALGPLLLCGDDRGVDDAIELEQATMAEGKIGEAMAIEGSVGADDLGPEVLDDGAVDGLARRHELAAKRIGFDDVRAEGAKDGGHGRLSASQSTGEAYTQHVISENS